MAKIKVDIGAVAKEWLELKGAQKAGEARLSALKEVLEPYLDSQPERMAEFSGFKFTLRDRERENFRLKEAKENLDNRMLRPYISLSSFTEIRTCSTGEPE